MDMVQEGKIERNAVLAGVALCVVFHVSMGVLLTAAASSRSTDGVAAESQAEAQPRRRGRFAEQAMRDRRQIEGPYERSTRFAESGAPRRSILDIRGRRGQEDLVGRPLRFLELAAGRRDLAREQGRRKELGLDFGRLPDESLQAMLIPRLGLKKKHKGLPKLTKYERRERVEAGVNLTRDNPSGSEVTSKAFKRKKAEYDRRRKKKPSLGDLIDAPEDDDPRKRPTRLDDIVGVATGSVDGEGAVEVAGSRYLGKVESAIRQSFNVPVFLTQDELKRLTVDIEIMKMDSSGHVLAFKLRRQSGNSAFNSAALEAIKRFAPSEGGARTLPAPPADMLQFVNQRGILVRLEGRKLR
jgi:hypothetical protein